MGIKAKNNGTTTAADWQQRIADLEHEAAETDRTLAAKRAQRRDAAGSVIVFGRDAGALAGLESAERDLERKADSLRAGIEVARTELQKAEAADRRAAAEERGRRRDEILEQIKKRASRVDASFGSAAVDLQEIAALLREFQNLGRGFSRSIKTIATRAALADGLRPFLEIVGSGHQLPLAKQLDSLPIIPRPEDSLTDTVAKTA